MSNLVDKTIELQMMTCLDALLDRANHDEYLQRIGKKEALRFLEEHRQYVEIIKLRLQRLESIDNAKPSEALELLGYLQDHHLNAIPYYDWLNDIEKYILKAQKEHKALEIIKEKTVDIWLIQNKKTLKQYNSMVDESRQLTEEEFNLLKGILNEEEVLE